MKKLFTFLILFCCTLASYAYDVEVNGLYINELSFIGHKVAVTASPSEAKYSGEIIIPAEVEIEGVKYKITEIEANAFEDCTGLTKIVIGSNVETIGEGAFKGCTSLKVVSFTDSKYKVFCAPIKYGSVGSGIFGDCPLDSIYLGRDLDYPTTQKDGTSPFYAVKSLRAARFSNSVKKVRKNILFYNPGLKYIELGDSIRIIEGGAFSDVDIEKIILPSSIDSIGDNVFASCKNLKSVISLRKQPLPINQQAFDNISSMNKKPYMYSVLYVPVGSIDAYKAATGWNKFYHIQEIKPDSLLAEAKDTTINIGDTINIKIKALPYYAELNNVEWSSSNKDIAKVDSVGNIVGVGEGVVTITASIKNTDVSTNIMLHVKTVPITYFSLTESSITLDFAEQHQLKPVILPENASNKKLNWYSSNTKAIIVSDSGLVTRIGAGESTVMAITQDGTNLVARCEVKDTSTGINNISIETSPVKFYNVFGISTQPDARGIYIVKYPDGTTKKIIKK